MRLVQQGAIQLHIGYHQLEGKRVELKKPYAVLDKVAGPDGTPYFKARGGGQAAPTLCPLQPVCLTGPLNPLYRWWAWCGISCCSRRGLGR